MCKWSWRSVERVKNVLLFFPSPPGGTLDAVFLRSPVLVVVDRVSTLSDPGLVLVQLWLDAGFSIGLAVFNPEFIPRFSLVMDSETQRSIPQNDWTCLQPCVWSISTAHVIKAYSLFVNGNMLLFFYVSKSLPAQSYFPAQLSKFLAWWEETAGSSARTDTGTSRLLSTHSDRKRERQPRVLSP